MKKTGKVYLCCIKQELNLRPFIPKINAQTNWAIYAEVTLSIAIIFFADPEESNLVLFTMFSNGY